MNPAIDSNRYTIALDESLPLPSAGLRFALKVTALLQRKLEAAGHVGEFSVEPFHNGREDGMSIACHSLNGVRTRSGWEATPRVWLFNDRHASDFFHCIVSDSHHDDFGCYDLWALENCDIDLSGGDPAEIATNAIFESFIRTFDTIRACNELRKPAWDDRYALDWEDADEGSIAHEFGFEFSIVAIGRDQALQLGVAEGMLDDDGYPAFAALMKRDEWLTSCILLARESLDAAKREVERYVNSHIAASC